MYPFDQPKAQLYARLGGGAWNDHWLLILMIDIIKKNILCLIVVYSKYLETYAKLMDRMHHSTYQSSSVWFLSVKMWVKWRINKICILASEKFWMMWWESYMDVQ